MSNKPTREQILAEPAGRQMDAWVAEFVMEWEHGCVSAIKPPDSRLDVWRTGEGKNFKFAAWTSTWNPSDDIAAAWQVVEKFQKLDLQTDDPKVFFVSFQIAGNPYWGPTINADTAPLAICRAALLAVTGDEL